MATTTKPHMSQVEQRYSRYRKVHTECREEMWGISKGDAVEDQGPEERGNRSSQVDSGTDYIKSQDTSTRGSAPGPGEETSILHKCPEGRGERTFNS